LVSFENLVEGIDFDIKFMQKIIYFFVLPIDIVNIIIYNIARKKENKRRKNK